MGIPENRDCQVASRSVLSDFAVGALTISAGDSFQSGTNRMLKAHTATAGITSLLVVLIGVAA